MVLADSRKEPAWQIGVASAQTRTKDLGLGRRDGHALPVYRVEAADGITEDQQSVGGAGELVVAPPPVGRNPVLDHVPKRLTRADRGKRVTWRELLEEVEQFGTIRGGFPTTDGAAQHQVGVVLHREHRKGGGPARDGIDRQHQFTQYAGRNTYGQRGVRDAHLEFLDRRPVVSELLEEHRRPRTTAGCVDDEVCGQQRLAIITVARDPSPRDALGIGIGRQAHDVVALEKLDVANGSHCLAHAELQQRPAHVIVHQRGGIRHGRTHHEMPAECGPESRKVAVVPLHRAVGDELVEEPWKQLADDLHSLAEQGVWMSVLGPLHGDVSERLAERRVRRR